MGKITLGYSVYSRIIRASGAHELAIKDTPVNFDSFVIRLDFGHGRNQTPGMTL